MDLSFWQQDWFPGQYWEYGVDLVGIFRHLINIFGVGSLNRILGGNVEDRLPSQSNRQSLIIPHGCILRYLTCVTLA